MLTRAQAFETLRSNLELTGLQERTVAERQSRLRAVVHGGLDVVGDCLIGSYRRKTLIGPLSRADVDMMMVLDRTYRDRGPAGVLTLVRDVLAKEYPRTRISRNGQAATVCFSDFAIDVVPGFRFPWWDPREGGHMCDTGAESWVSTDPRAHEAKSAAGKPRPRRQPGSLDQAAQGLEPRTRRPAALLPPRDAGVVRLRHLIVVA